MNRPTDDEILAALVGDSRMTYVVANRLRRTVGEVDTAFVLRRLKALEKVGKVERTRSAYLVQICWRAVAATDAEGK